MDDRWFFQSGDKLIGPLDSAQLRQLARRGQLQPETLVRRGEGPAWTQAGKIRGLEFAASAAAPAAAPPAAAGPSAPVAVAPQPSPAASVQPAAGSPTSAAPGSAPGAGSAKASAPLKRAKPIERAGAAGRQPPISDSSQQFPPLVPPPIAPGVGGSTLEIPSPYGAAPPPGVLPAGIPTGLPVGLPVGQPVGPPIGTPPVAPAYAPPVQPGPVESGLPRIQIGTPAAAAPTTARNDARPIGAKRQASRKKLIWMAAAGGAALLLVGGVGAAMALLGSSGDKVVATKAKPTLEDELAGETADESAGGSKADADAVDEGDGASASDLPERMAASGGASESAAGSTAKTGAAKTGTPKSAGTKASSKGRAAGGEDVETAHNAVLRWFDLARVSSIKGAKFKLQLTGAWQETPAGGPARVYVELSVTNTQPDSPYDYQPWNGGSKLTALLATEAGVACRLLSPSEAPDAARQTAPLRVKPGQSFRELLVFEAPEGPFELLHLYLPVAPSTAKQRYLGLKIPSDLVAAQKPVELADAPAGSSTPAAKPSSPAPAATTASADAPPADAPPAVAPPNGAPAPAPKPAAPREETIDDLRKSIVDSVKEKETEKTKQPEMKAKPGEAPKPSDADGASAVERAFPGAFRGTAGA